MSRFARHHSVQLSLLVLLLALCLPVLGLATDTATIVRVVDGDTLAVSMNGHTEKVRLIGVDTPEVHVSSKLHRDADRTRQDEATIKALGQRAWEFTESLVHAGDTVQLEYDQQARDKYHRLLAFVWLADGRMLNEVLVCEGYTNAYTRYPFKQEYMTRFRACARQAQEGNKGLWGAGLAAQAPASPPAVQTAGTDAVGEVHGNKRSRIYHLPECPNYQDISPKNVVPFKSEEDARRAGYRRAKNCP